MERDKFEIVVGDCGAEIISLELSNFISQFRRNYITAYAFVKFHDFRHGEQFNFVKKIVEGRDRNNWDINGEFEKFFSEYDRTVATYGDVFSYNKSLPPEIELNFSEISKNSPLAFMGYCTGTAILALALAVALAGGEADLTKNKFKVNSLLDAIRKWR